MLQIAKIVVDPLVWKTPLIVVTTAAVLVFLYYVYIGITLKMAKDRNRDPLGWILLSIFVSPFLTWIILYFVEDAKK